jgi:putative spermidine/putrescine transport system substrate-binding protein
MRVFAVLALGLLAASPKAPTESHATPPPSPPPASPAAPGKAAAKPPEKPAPPAPPTLAVALPGGAPLDAIQHFLLKPYTEAGGLPVTPFPWDGGSLDGLKKPAPDLVLVTAAQLSAGCKAQIFNRLDWNRLGRDRYQPEAVSDCGVGAYQETTALAWDPEKLQAAPNWGDFWDVARHPGRRGLPHTARFTLEIALMADGVTTGDIYRTLRSPDGLDRAFRKLDQLKPYIVWWDKPADAAQMLATGRVLLTAAPAGAVLRLTTAKRHFGVQWTGSLAAWHSWAVPHGAARPDAAALALLVAGDLARQANFAQATFEAPAARDALALLPPSLQLQATGNSALTYDEGFWAENGEKLEARFAAWVAK